MTANGTLLYQLVKEGIAYTTKMFADDICQRFHTKDISKRKKRKGANVLFQHKVSMMCNNPLLWLVIYDRDIPSFFLYLQRAENSDSGNVLEEPCFEDIER